MEEGDEHSDGVNVGVVNVAEKLRVIPPPGTGQRIYEIDPYLKDHQAHLDYRYDILMTVY